MSNKQPPIFRDTSFVTKNMVSTLKDVRNSLPFSIGGVTQHGPDHFRSNLNNQDAMAFVVEGEFIAGIVCDGCTGTHSRLRAEHSNNEIGAKLIARFAIDGIRYLFNKHNKTSKIGSNEEIKLDDFFIRSLQEFIIEKINYVAKSFGNFDSESDVVLGDFFMTTILGFIVIENRYIIFNSGDGYIAVNSTFVELEDHGTYLPKIIINSNNGNNGINIFKKGHINDIENIILASDGCRNLIENHGETLEKYIEDVSDLLPGYDSIMLRKFRTQVIWNKTVKKTASQEAWFDDDATIVMLRRVDNIKKGDDYVNS